MKSKIAIGLLFAVLCYQQSLAQEEYAHYIPDAIAMGYGGSLVSYTDRPSILYWNPGGLAFATNDQLLVNINHLVSLNHLSFTKFFPPKNAFGLALSRIVQPQKFLDIATVAYSRRLTRYVAIGGNLNWGRVNENKDTFITFGLGCLLRPSINRHSFYQAGLSPQYLFANPDLYEKLAFGIMIHNVPLDNGSMTHVVRFGSIFKFTNWGPIFNFDYHVSHGKNSAHLGSGLQISSIAHFYTGVKNFDIKALAIGCSFAISVISTDLVYNVQTEKVDLSLSLKLNDDSHTIAKRYVDRGTRKIKENSFREALTEFDNSLSYNQNNERIIYLTNALKKKIEKEDKTIDSLMTAAENFLDKDWKITAALTYKKVLGIDDKNKKALKILERLSPHLQEYVALLFEKGITSFKNKDFDKAKLTLKEILYIDNNHKGAIVYLSKIDSVNSYLSNEYYYHGLSYYKQRHLEKAKTLFKTVLEINPQHNEAKYYLDIIDKEILNNNQIIDKLMEEANTLEKSGNYILASMKYKEILNIDRDYEKAEKQLELLQTYINAIIGQKYQRAKKLYDRGNFRDAKLAFEDILSMQSNHKQAKNYLKKIRDAQSEEVEKYYQLAQQQIAENRWDEALRTCEQALLINPDHVNTSKLRTEILNHISLEQLQEKALQLFKRGDYVNAMNTFSQILEKDPTHVIAKTYINECKIKLNRRIMEFFNSGMDFYTRGNYEAAIREWNRILEIDPKHESALEYKKRAQERLEALKKLP